VAPLDSNYAAGRVKVGKFTSLEILLLFLLDHSCAIGSKPFHRGIVRSVMGAVVDLPAASLQPMIAMCESMGVAMQVRHTAYALSYRLFRPLFAVVAKHLPFNAMINCCQCNVLHVCILLLIRSYVRPMIAHLLLCWLMC
jgi:hypothetical protein